MNKSHFNLELSIHSCLKDVKIPFEKKLIIKRWSEAHLHEFLTFLPYFMTTYSYEKEILSTGS